MNSTPDHATSNIALRIAEAGRVTAADFPNIIPLQSRPEQQILCVVNGSLKLHINDVVYEAGAGELFFVQSGSLLSVSDPTPGCVYEYIVFNLRAIVGDSEICLACCDHMEDNSWQMHSNLGRNPLVLRELFDRMYRLASIAPSVGGELELRGLLLQFIGRMLQDGRWESTTPMQETDARAQRAVRRVLALIEENYAQDLTLADMAATAQLSPNYFCRYFKKIAGCAPVEFLIDYRINMAAQLLVTTEDSIADIALACGFNDASHFIKFFRRQKNITPRRYRVMYAKTGDV